MKTISSLITAIAVGALVTIASSAGAADEQPATPAKPAAPAKSAEKAKPYTLKTCLVSGEELGGMGDPYTFTHKGREIKLCCKSCLKDFSKDTAKYVKKLETAEKSQKSGKPHAHDKSHDGHQH